MHPPLVLHLADEWGALIASGVHESASALTRVLVGHEGETVRAIARASGASVRVDAATGDVRLGGTPAEVAAARAAIARVLTPGATIDVAAEWGGLIARGAHASPAALVSFVIGRHGETVARLQRASRGGVVWASRDGSRLYVSGDPAAVARARGALGRLVTPSVELDAATEWASLVSGGVHESPHHALRVLAGVGAAGLHEIEQASGARVWLGGGGGRGRDEGGGRVCISGPPAAVARARAAIGRAVRPAVTIDVGSHWAQVCHRRRCARTNTHLRYDCNCATIV